MLEEEAFNFVPLQGTGLTNELNSLVSTSETNFTGLMNPRLVETKVYVHHTYMHAYKV